MTLALRPAQIALGAEYAKPDEGTLVTARVISQAHVGAAGSLPFSWAPIRSDWSRISGSSLIWSSWRYQSAAGFCFMGADAVPGD